MTTEAAKRRNGALKRAVKSVVECLRRDSLRQACRVVERFFEKYGTNEELDGFAHFTYAVQNHVSDKISRHAPRIEQACHVGALTYCKERRNHVILEQHTLLANELDYRLGELLGPSKFSNGDFLGAGRWKVKAVLNENFPDRVYRQGGYLYLLLHPDGREKRLFERELLHIPEDQIIRGNAVDKERDSVPASSADLQDTIPDTSKEQN